MDRVAIDRVRGRICAGCYRNRHQSRYSSKQWDRGSGVSRCISCVDRQVPNNASNRRSGSARFEESFLSSVSFDNPYRPYAETTFRSVAKGVYGSGPRWGEPCVIKWFRSDAAFADIFFTLDVRAVDLALGIVDLFNWRVLTDKIIKVNIPTVWTATDNSCSPWAGQHVLCEPFIQNYQKFNSNTGWNDTSTEWGKVMQALSHFSYHISGGEHVLCDIQGGICENEAIITDPVILTKNRIYGVTDLGEIGIINFFSQHVCSRYCRSHWIKPSNPVRCFNSGRGTSMIVWDGW